MYLNLDINGELKFTAADMVGKMIAVMGGTGSGKSYSQGVLAEELIPLFPLTIVDTAGEYWTLREKYSDILIVGQFMYSDDETPARIDHCDLEISVADAEMIAEYSFRNKVSVILELRYFEPHERIELLTAYFKRLWYLIMRKPQPYGVFIDEAQNYIPQNGKSAIKDVLVRFAKEGRKEGVTCVFGTQRPASISKDVLNMCMIRILHAVYYPTDIEVYADGVPRREAAEVRKINRELKAGDAIFVSEPQSWVVTMRPRQTTHAGATPLLNGQSPSLREVDKQTVEELKALLVPTATKGDAGVDPKEASQRDVIAALQRDNAAQAKQIAALCKEVEHWKGLVQGQNVADALPGVQLRMDDEPLPDALASKVSARESAAQTRVVKRQAAALNRLKAKTTTLPSYEREALYWLSRHPGQWVQREDITRTLIINPSKLSMQKLVDTGLVERDKRSKFHKFRFRAGILQQMFPDLNADYVLDQISPIKEKVA